MRILLAILCFFMFTGVESLAQCTNHTINVTSGTWPSEVSWSLVNGGGVTVAAGGATFSGTFCLANGCYTLFLNDSFGDGWNGAVITITNNLGQTVLSTTLATGYTGSAQLEVGVGSCGTSCPYSISLSAGTWPTEVSWNLTDANGTVVSSGGAPTTVTACLSTGCYTMNMFDSYGDGWNGATFTINGPNGVEGTGTLVNGYNGVQTISIGGADCGLGGNCPYNLSVGGGGFDNEITWTLADENGNSVASGFAPQVSNLCLTDGCYQFNMYDSWGDGWNGATYELTDENGTVITSGTLGAGSFGTTTIGINDPDCENINNGPVTASDCVDAVDVCTDLNFMIDPNGWGSINEVPPLGSLANPDYGFFGFNPWGTTNMGCLRSGELNSTWMVVNIWESGWLEFTFGGLGMQAGFYDWSMWTYDENTCQDIFNNTLAPVRCNWNGTSFGGTGLASTLPPDGDASNYEPPLWVEAGEQYLICFSNWSSVTTVVPLEFGGTAVVGCGALLLPVSWLGFSGVPVAAGIHLNWSTASEQQNSGFEIQHSIDGLNWEKIGEKQGQGTSTTVSAYEYLHSTPVAGNNYYRIAQIDLNGAINYSQIIAVPWLTHQAAVVSPNPSEGTLYFRLNGNEILAIRCFDPYGREVPIQMNCYPDQCELMLGQVPPGYYHLSIQLVNGESVKERILIAR